MAKVTMPQLGESVAEGTIGRWLKQPGDAVAKYEPLLEVITDKVNAEVPSPYAGILREILFEEGAVVPNNTEIAVIETDEDAASGSAGAPAASAGCARRAVAHGPAGSDERPVASSAESGPIASAPPAPAPVASAAPAPVAVPADHDPNARMTPAVRRLLREHDLERSPGEGHRRWRPHHP